MVAKYLSITATRLAYQLIMPIITGSQSRARVQVASLKSRTGTTRPGRSNAIGSVKTKPKEAVQPSDRREARVQLTYKIQKASQRRLTDKRMVINFTR